MANPTTNYGFVLPTSTDLVTDLPADFDVALQGVDTRLKALQPGTTLGDLMYASATANTNTRLGIGSNGQVLSISGGVPVWATTADQTPLTTKGDLFTFTTVDARLGVGANNTVLTADSAEATGLKWATASSGGMTLLSTTTLSGSSTVSITGISSAYNDLVIDIFATTQTSNTDCSINPNGNAGITDNMRGGSTLQQLNDGSMRLNNNVAGPLSSSTDNSWRLIISNYAATTNGGKPFNMYAGYIASDSSKQIMHNRGRIKTTSAISSLDFVSGVNWTAGTVEIYGVK